MLIEEGEQLRWGSCFERVRELVERAEDRLQLVPLIALDPLKPLTKLHDDLVLDERAVGVGFGAL